MRAEEIPTLRYLGALICTAHASSSLGVETQKLTRRKTRILSVFALMRMLALKDASCLHCAYGQFVSFGTQLSLGEISSPRVIHSRHECDAGVVREVSPKPGPEKSHRELLKATQSSTKSRILVSICSIHRSPFWTGLLRAGLPPARRRELRQLWTGTGSTSEPAPGH